MKGCLIMINIQLHISDSEEVNIYSILNVDF